MNAPIHASSVRPWTTFQALQLEGLDDAAALRVACALERASDNLRRFAIVMAALGEHGMTNEKASAWLEARGYIQRVPRLCVSCGCEFHPPKPHEHADATDRVLRLVFCAGCIDRREVGGDLG